MSEHIGEWHPVTATIDADGVLDIEVNHPDTCSTCDLSLEISNWGVDRFGITAPGTYRARYRLWSIRLAPHIGDEEFDDCVEVEQIIESPEESARIVDMNLRNMGSVGLS